MIFGIGNDIVETSRIEKIYQKFGEHFPRRILTPNEYKVFQERKKNISFLAKRFAAKEAFSKALGIGFRAQVSFQSIAIENNNMGKPILNFSNELTRFMNEKKILHCHLTISDEKNLASAIVILET